MKKIIFGFIIGCTVAISGTAFAASIAATANSYKVTLNGSAISLAGYNINGNTYFKLRDIADNVGGFTVGFENSTITLTTNRPAMNGIENGTPPTLEEMKTKLSQDVKDGKLTQAQADEMSKQMDSGKMPTPSVNK